MPVVSIPALYRHLRAGRITRAEFLCVVGAILITHLPHFIILFITMWEIYIACAISSDHTLYTPATACTNVTTFVMDVPRYQEIQLYPRWREDGGSTPRYEVTTIVEIVTTSCDYRPQPLLKRSGGFMAVHRLHRPGRMAIPWNLGWGPRAMRAPIEVDFRFRDRLVQDMLAVI